MRNGAADREDVASCNAHIAALSATLDLTARPDPKTAFLRHVRAINPVYPNLGLTQPTLSKVQFISDDADGVPVVWAVAQGASARHRIVYLHGGGWVTGSSAIYRWIAGILSQMSASIVLMVDYRLAPEYPFPAGLEDCVKALRWAGSHGPNGITTKAISLAVVGDSAGGNLAVAAGLCVTDDNERMPNCIATIGGVFDLRPDHPHGPEKEPLFADPWKLVRELYLPFSESPDNPLISPQNASCAALERLPPMFLQFSSSEFAASSNRQFAMRLDEASVRYSMSVWPNLPHVWHLFPSVLPEATDAIREIAFFIHSNQRSRPGAWCR